MKRFILSVLSFLMSFSIIISFAEQDITITELNGHRYKVVKGKYTWEEAYAACLRDGGHLLTITSADEQRFVEKLNVDNITAWIGLRRGIDDAWYWITGEEYDYSNWGYGEPNNYYLEEYPFENVGAMRPDWNDYHENNNADVYGYICEWDDLPLQEINSLNSEQIHVVNETEQIDDTKKIRFRDIPWGSSAVYVGDVLKREGINFSLFDPDITGFNWGKQLVSQKYGPGEVESGIGSFSTDFSPARDVAGYKPTRITTYFAYRPVNGRIQLNNKNAALYAGMYCFQSDNLMSLFADFKDKLTSLYGPCRYSGGEDILDEIFGKSSYFYFSVDPDETFAIWEDEDAYLALVACDIPEGVNSAVFKDEVRLVYLCKEGDSWLEEAIESKKQENREIESEKYGNGNTDGL